MVQIQAEGRWRISWTIDIEFDDPEMFIQSGQSLLHRFDGMESLCAASLSIDGWSNRVPREDESIRLAWAPRPRSEDQELFARCEIEVGSLVPYQEPIYWVDPIASGGWSVRTLGDVSSTKQALALVGYLFLGFARPFRKEIFTQDAYNELLAALEKLT